MKNQSTSGNVEIKSSFGFSCNKKVVEELTPTTQDRLQYKVSTKAFFRLMSKVIKKLKINQDFNTVSLAVVPSLRVKRISFCGFIIVLPYLLSFNSEVFLGWFVRKHAVRIRNLLKLKVVIVVVVIVVIVIVRQGLVCSQKLLLQDHLILILYFSFQME